MRGRITALTELVSRVPWQQLSSAWVGTDPADVVFAAMLEI
jgi:hypothetical protein